MSNISKKHRERNCKAIEDHQKYITRITKSFYYGKLPRTDRLSLPVTELAAEWFSESQRGKSLDRLYCDNAAEISTNACVSPCSLVLAMLYLERLKKLNPDYLEKTAPSDLFLVSLMVSCKFLYDDGETDGVFVDEWATSGGISVKELVQLERDFLNAIDWEIYVNEPTFWKKLTEIETTLARKQGISRGFFTYTELDSLLTSIEVHNIVQCIVATFVFLSASYVATLLALVGSVFVVTHVTDITVEPKKIDNQRNNSFLPMFYDLIDADLDDIERDVLREINELETDYVLKNGVKAVDVLKTGIFLASIEGLLKPFCNKTNQTCSVVEKNVQNVSWDWWTIPAMKWLAQTSEFTDIFKLPTFDLNYIAYFFETYVSNVKYIELEDQVHKATKTRIQDQMENSWHKEWTDTINYQFYDEELYYNIGNIRS